MARNLYETYPSNSPAVDPEYPIGKARNDTFEDANNGFPFEEGWLNELLGFFGAIQQESGFTPSGNAEQASASQYLDGLRSLGVSLTRLTEGTAALTYQSLITFIQAGYGLTLTGSQVKQQNSSGDSVALRNGRWETKGGAGGDVAKRPTYYDINVGDLIWTNSTGSAMVLYDPSTPLPLTGITAVGSHGLLNPCLILRNGTTMDSCPVSCAYENVGGNLAVTLAKGQFCRDALLSYTTARLYFGSLTNPAL